MDSDPARMTRGRYPTAPRQGFQVVVTRSWGRSDYFYTETEGGILINLTEGAILQITDKDKDEVTSYNPRQWRTVSSRKIAPKAVV